jgi:hypothetical protein
MFLNKSKGGFYDYDNLLTSPEKKKSEGILCSNVLNVLFGGGEVLETSSVA